MPPRLQERDRDGSKGIPTDLISDILMRLDVKTLSRFRCVCKAWNKEISSPRFINAHRRRSISRGLYDMLFVHADRDKSEADCKWWIYKFTMVSDGTIGTYNNSNSIKVPHMFSPRPLALALNCDLLCLMNWKDKGFLLCNPRTGEVQPLPAPPIANHYCHWRGRVFGYVDSTRQYVLVSLYYDYSLGKDITFKFCFSSNYECEHHGDRSCSCSIASSSWKEIEEASPLRFGSSGILVNNSVYWRDYGQEGKVEIVSLELEDEKYKIISCPPQFSGFTPTLIDLKGTLAAALIDTSSLDIWVLDQFMINNCSHSCGWVRKYSINVANILDPENWYKVFNKSSRNGELIVSEFSPGFTHCVCNPEEGLPKYYVCNPEKGSFSALIDPCSGALRTPSKYMSMGFLWESLFSFGVSSY